MSQSPVPRAERADALILLGMIQSMTKQQQVFPGQCPMAQMKEFSRCQKTGLILLSGLTGFFGFQFFAAAATFPRPECHKFLSNTIECFFIDQTTGQILRWSASASDRSSRGETRVVPGAISSLRSNAVSCEAGRDDGGLPSRSCFFIGNDRQLKMIRRHHLSPGWQPVVTIGSPPTNIDHANNQLSCLKYGGRSEALQVNRACLVKAETGATWLRRYTPPVALSSPRGWNAWENTGASWDVGNCVEDGTLMAYCTLSNHGVSSPGETSLYNLIFHREWPAPTPRRTPPSWALVNTSRYSTPPLSGRPVCLQGLINREPVRRERFCLGIGSYSGEGGSLLSVWYKNFAPVGSPGSSTEPFSRAFFLNNVGSHAIQPNCILIPQGSSSPVSSHSFFCLQASGDGSTRNNLELLLFNRESTPVWAGSMTTDSSDSLTGRALGTPACVAMNSNQIECVYLGGSGRMTRLSLYRSGSVFSDMITTELDAIPAG